MNNVNKPNGFGNRMNSKSYVPVKVSDNKIKLSDNINTSDSYSKHLITIVLGTLLGGIITVSIVSYL